MDISEAIWFWQQVFFYPIEFFDKAELDVELGTTIKDALFWTFTITFIPQVVAVGIVALVGLVIFLSMNSGPLDIVYHATTMGFAVLTGFGASLISSIGTVFYIIFTTTIMFITSKIFVQEISFNRLLRAITICTPHIIILFVLMVLGLVLGIVNVFIIINGKWIEGAICLGLLILCFQGILKMRRTINYAVKTAGRFDEKKGEKVASVWFVLTALFALVTCVLFLLFGVYVLIARIAGGPSIG